jgi:filamentous hemagglutinin
LRTTTANAQDRATSSRFVRNLALSVSGGALLTVLGASAAHAQDSAQASTDSAGAGAAHSGDATAVGNQSGTNATQGGTISGGAGGLQVLDQQANVANTGVAVANTGGNRAVGNSSNNTSLASQVGGLGGGAVNGGHVANSSDGSATIWTGNASAVGNSSTTVIDQQAHGQLGGILLINQDATVTNSGVALASSGGNRARGNDSDNDSQLFETGIVAGGLAANDGKSTNGSNGKATINTGNASATGNHSETSIAQSTAGAAGGEPGGLVLIDQDAGVANTGVAVANTGRNRARGNTSNSGAYANQNTGGATPVFDPAGVASNDGEASNWSDGTAGVSTGDAGASGNESRTSLRQTADADSTGNGGLSLIIQGSTVLNDGLAVANTGGNRARGNDSDNGDGHDAGAALIQNGPFGGPAVDVGVISNAGRASNASDGSAEIHTGGADAVGNRARTDVAQSAITDGGDLNLYTQGSLVTNSGIGVANSGRNRALGNDSENDVLTQQTNSVPASGVDAGFAVVGNSGTAANSSDGTASITTGNASAVGNDATTSVAQTIDPMGLVIPIQAAAVVNAGVGLANSGGNAALGNNSLNSASLIQGSSVGTNNLGTTDVDAGLLVASNSGEGSNTSDGTASIATGAAAAAGNESSTTITQDSTGSVDGLGFVLNTQAAAVANVGVGVANSGRNVAVGNVSEGTAFANQGTAIGSNNGIDPVDVTAGIIAASNSGTASNTSDGTATIATGDARATGNRSATWIGQSETASVDGLGAVINTQVGAVANIGIGVANSGGNLAVGNTSDNEADLGQTAEVGSSNVGPTDIAAGSITAANNGSSENTSDGGADVRTGTADATGSSSTTQLSQDADGHVDGLGLVLNTQVGGVVNAGLGVANSGLNAAVGNASTNIGDNLEPGAGLDQSALVGSDARGLDLTVFGPLVAANSGTASNTSDGTGKVHTGGAHAQGNGSTTSLSQSQDGTIDDLGLAVNTQVGGVANLGVGVANSGLNAAIGNASDNGGGDVPLAQGGAFLEQSAQIGSGNLGPTDLTVFGPAVANNAGEASNTSDGRATVGTGDARANGNVSTTNVSQHQTSEVTGMGLVVGTQVGGVANVGVGVANSGLNLAVGNASTNTAGAQQLSFLVSSGGALPVLTIVGPAVANDSGQATNTSDGEACACTGDAVASGNVSSTTLIQDLDTRVGSGVAVITEAGGVLNAGVGLANSGLNLAVGNASTNTATSDQLSEIADALVGPVVGPQVVHNGGGANNASAGTGKVGTGAATATGNMSTTALTQAAAVDSDFAVATLAGGTTNTGLGLANSGLNLGVGNRSTNEATLEQDARGAGIASNDGTADNESDGTAIIGNPDCLIPGTTTPGPTTPGVASLPKTGGPLEAEAVFGVMLLLMGFGLRRSAGAGDGNRTRVLSLGS